jgi:hypothetical protein
MTIPQAITTYWPLIIFLIGGIVSVITTWINLNNKISGVLNDGAERDKEIAELKGIIKSMTPDMNTIKLDVAVIKNDISYIKGALQSKPAAVTNNNL